MLVIIPLVNWSQCFGEIEPMGTGLHDYESQITGSTIRKVGT